jgi:transcriptional regulator with XRE-family HTH domain
MGRLERGEVEISVEVLRRLASILNVEAGVLLLITSALISGNPAQAVFQIAHQQLEALERSGALALIVEIASSVQSQSGQSRASIAADRMGKIHAMRQAGMAMGEIAKSLNLSKSTVHKYLKKEL